MIRLSKPIVDFHAHFPVSGTWSGGELHPRLKEYNRRAQRPHA